MGSNGVSPRTADHTGEETGNDNNNGTGRALARSGKGTTWKVYVLRQLVRVLVTVFLLFFLALIILGREYSRRIDILHGLFKHILLQYCNNHVRLKIPWKERNETSKTIQQKCEKYKRKSLRKGKKKKKAFIFYFILFEKMVGLPD